MVVNKSLAHHEFLVAKEFLANNVCDHFDVLGVHYVEDILLLRAYLPVGMAWHIANLDGSPLIESEILLYESGFHSWICHLDNLTDYILVGGDPTQRVEIVDPYSFDKLLDEETQHLWNTAKLYNAWQNLGANQQTIKGHKGFLFRLWAPNAKYVSVVGDFNAWNPLRHGMRYIKAAGLWEIFVPNVGELLNYKYHIIPLTGAPKLKSDPYAIRMQHPPQTASVTSYYPSVKWEDRAWMEERSKVKIQNTAMSVYEVHLGSWRIKNGRFMSYYEMESSLVEYVKDMGFTHVEFMPINEYPLEDSWGYQPLGLYSPTIRHGTAKELKYLVNSFHKEGIGVILDWVPAHFPADEHGLIKFDGSCLYEYEDSRKGFHPEWKTMIFNYARNEVLNYLISNAVYWLQEFHIDGLRFDAVSSMLYLSYARVASQWTPNMHGGAENIEAVAFIKEINDYIHKNYPGVITAAEEATPWPGVTSEVERGGLGFDFKWNMGWMNDSLKYIHKEPSKKPFHHHEITHCIDYAFSENYVLPLSHDEVVHGKSSLIGKMPGYDEHKFALLRAYYCYMWAHPGKKLLFMGNEFGQRGEWNFKSELEWNLLQYKPHKGLQKLIKELNIFYKNQPALYKKDSDASFFSWIKKNDANESIYAFFRTDASSDQIIVFVVNFSNRFFKNKLLGLPKAGAWEVVFDSEAEIFGGSVANWQKTIRSNDTSQDNFYNSICFDLPAASALYFKYRG